MIYCCECKKEVEARLTNGSEIYPHRNDLKHRKFYICDNCGNYVGTHKDTEIPLGTIPNKTIREKRKRIHAIIDPLWRSGKIKRTELYKILSSTLGIKYHTANLSTEEQCDIALSVAYSIRNQIQLSI